LKTVDLIDKIHKRQLGRFLWHLERTGQITDALSQDIKRAFGFIFEDVKKAVTQGEHGKEIENDE
jgi:hypothetical protein